MRVLLDTNILIHREASTVVRGDIGNVFNWLDKLKHDKCAHPVSLSEIEKHKDERVRNTFRAKLQSYNILKTTAPMSAGASQFAAADKSENDRNDTIIVNEVVANRVDLLITEDRGVHTKAAILGIADRVFTLDAFLEKVTAENPSLVDYKVLAVKKTVFGTTDVTAEFFESFRQDYGGIAFDRWFARKADETTYVCYQGSDLVAFLYLKVEGPEENYGDIDPRFPPKRRLKIGTFKVEMNGFKLGERFLKIIFDKTTPRTTRMPRCGSGSVPIAIGWKCTNCRRTHRSSIPRSAFGNTRARPELTTGTSQPPRNWSAPCHGSSERCNSILNRSDPICFLFADRDVPLLMRDCISKSIRNRC